MDCARIALAAGKAVLCEKPLALNAEQARALVAEAGARGVFLMEGMWTRCFPAIREARRLLRSGAIGDVVAVQADFGWPAEPNGAHARTLDPISGGASLDVAMYPIAHVLLALPSAEPPADIVASGTSRAAADGRGRVDWAVGATLSGFPARPRLVASLLCTLEASTPEEVVFTGTTGTLRIHRPAHTPSRLTLAVASGREAARAEELHFPLPAVPEGVPNFHYPGSQAFVYEARCVHAALREGLLEASEWTHAESVTCASIVDAMRDAVISRGLLVDD